MLFNSYGFVLCFLPVTLLVFLLLRHFKQQRLLIAWLVIASLAFYAKWDPRYLFLLLGSIVINFYIGYFMAREAQLSNRRIILWVGLVFNIGLLIVYKYMPFIFYNIKVIANAQVVAPEIIMPLGISFFTFTQLAYLIDTYREGVSDYTILDYLCFVTFFPHLIAGPIYHHHEMMPQFSALAEKKFAYEDVAIGLTFFIIGLFKKTILADSLAGIATPEFRMAVDFQQMSFFTAWVGALAYTFQLYFDFSGYSDMAIGLGRLFGLRLPLNFNSPYRASNIIEFWHRWHITLSRFLRDYLYIPLGGNRKGGKRRYCNLLITMILGGLWHGAAWTFVVWGLLHGFYLCLNHAWWHLKEKHRPFAGCPGWLSRILAMGLTFTAVVVAWVFFRAENFQIASNMLYSMFGYNTLIRGQEFWFYLTNYRFYILLLSFFIVWTLPNAQQMLLRYKPALETYLDEVQPYPWPRLIWAPTGKWAIVIALMGLIALLSLGRVTEFIYYQF